MTFITGDGVVPSNEGRGYVLRRIIRRALVHARKVDMKRPLSDAVAITEGLFEEPYPELKQRTAAIAGVVRAESERFQKPLDHGMEQFDKVASRHHTVIPTA